MVSKVIICKMYDKNSLLLLLYLLATGYKEIEKEPVAESTAKRKRGKVCVNSN